MRINPEKARRACCSPGRNPPREPFAVWTLMIRLGLPIMPTSLSYGTSAVMSARTSGMLATMLVLMIVTLTAEEIPLFEAGTEPMTELAFGLRNRPIPNPTRTSPTTIWEEGEDWSNRDKEKNPDEATMSQSVMRPGAPHLSDRCALIGPMTSSVSSRGLRDSPA